MHELRLLDAQWRVNYSARRLDEFVQRCHERGLAVTPQRLAVIRALLASKEHPSAEHICATVRKELSHISLATVHRILEQFCEVGEARKVTPLHESARYDGHTQPHHHVVCVQCKQIRDIEMPEADRLIKGEKTASGSSRCWVARCKSMLFANSAGPNSQHAGGRLEQNASKGTRRGTTNQAAEKRNG